MLSPEALDSEVVSGISVGFALIFYAPLAVIATLFFVYSVFSRRSVLRPAKVLSILWLVACVPASLLILMGYAFNSNKLSPLVAISLWVSIGLAMLWLPVGLRVVLRLKPM